MRAVRQWSGFIPLPATFFNLGDFFSNNRWNKNIATKWKRRRRRLEFKHAAIVGEVGGDIG